MTTPGMGTTLMARLPMNLRGFTLERRRMARVLRGPRAGGCGGGQLVTGGARGHACPAARRGRYRAKVERADRQR